MITEADLASILLDQALAARVRERLELSVRPGKVDLVVFNPERAHRVGSTQLEDTGYRMGEHRLTVEVRHGVIRVLYIHPYPGDGPATRYLDVPFDDADPELLAKFVRDGLEAVRL